MFSFASHFIQNIVSTRNPKQTQPNIRSFRDLKPLSVTTTLPKPGHIPNEFGSFIFVVNVVWRLQLQ